MRRNGWKGNPLTGVVVEVAEQKRWKHCVGSTIRIAVVNVHRRRPQPAAYWGASLEHPDVTDRRAVPLRVPM